MNVITGVGTTGSTLVRRKDVSRTGFVGSVKTGRILARGAAEEFKGSIPELGEEKPMGLTSIGRSCFAAVQYLPIDSREIA